jgi:hypothetical protein
LAVAVDGLRRNWSAFLERDILPKERDEHLMPRLGDPHTVWKAALRDVTGYGQKDLWAQEGVVKALLYRQWSMSETMSDEL